jgi:hypothetical protein
MLLSDISSLQRVISRPNGLPISEIKYGDSVDPEIEGLYSRSPVITQIYFPKEEMYDIDDPVSISHLNIIQLDFTDSLGALDFRFRENRRRSKQEYSSKIVARPKYNRS